MQQRSIAFSAKGISFQYPDVNDPMLAELKELAAITIDPSIGELDQVKTILGYAHGLFTHDGDSRPTTSDPVTIIKEARLGKQFRCVEYSLLGMSLLWAYGIPARTVGLKTRDVETRKYGAGHVVVEFWSKDYRKWCMCDVQAGIIPVAADILLSAYEFGEKIAQEVPIGCIAIQGSRFAVTESFADMSAYITWIKDYLFFYDTPLEIIFEGVDAARRIVMLVPKGVKPPILFQNMFEMNALYTYDVLDFYPTL